METLETNLNTIPSVISNKIGRNEKITITKGNESKVMKYKKAQPLLEEGWTLVGQDWVESWFRYYGQSDGINGSNAGNESSHNAYAQNATEFGFINLNGSVGVGNNGNPITYDDWINYFVYSRKPIGKRAHDTGYWGVGGSVIFPIRFGFHDYVATILDGKYLIYRYNWNIDISEFTFAEAMRKNPSLQVSQEEVDETTYRELVHADKFENLPTFYFSIKKYKGIGSVHFQPKNIIKNLNNTYHIARNQLKCFVHSEGRELQTTALYFPTINGGKVCRFLDDLELVGKNIAVGDGIFDVYHYKYIVDDFSAMDANEIKKVTDNYDNVFKVPGGKPSTPYNHFFNDQRLYLTSESLGTGKMSAVLYNYSNMVFVQVGGDFKFSTVKSANVDENLSNEAIVVHKDYIDSNKIKQHKGNKGEDNKIIECYDEIMNDGPKKANIMSSIQTLSNYELTPPDIKDELNHRKFKPIESREHDWAVKKTVNDNYTLHMEFMNNSEDWGHIDKLNFTMDEDGIPYNALVVDSFSTQSEKIDSFRRALKNKNVPHLKKVWAVQLEDLVNHKESNFRVIWEK